MLLRGDPTYPSARALLGDYAIKQNDQDRSQPLLNDVMDGTFKPVHLRWKHYWRAQQDAEQRLSECRSKRYETTLALNDAVRQIHRTLSSHRNLQVSVLLCELLPGGNLDVLYRPVAQQLLMLAPYADRIQNAEDAIICPDIRQAFGERLEHARCAQRSFDAALETAFQAQRARAAHDDDWVQAFNRFHKAVEFVAFRHRSDLSEWIREWMAASVRPSIPTADELPASP